MNSTLWCINKLLPSPKREEPMRIKKKQEARCSKPRNAETQELRSKRCSSFQGNHQPLHQTYLANRSPDNRAERSSWWRGSSLVVGMGGLQFLRIESKRLELILEEGGRPMDFGSQNEVTNTSIMFFQAEKASNGLCTKLTD